MILGNHSLTPASLASAGESAVSLPPFYRLILSSCRVTIRGLRATDLLSLDDVPNFPVPVASSVAVRAVNHADFLRTARTVVRVVPSTY